MRTREAAEKLADIAAERRPTIPEAISCFFWISFALVHVVFSRYSFAGCCANSEWLQSEKFSSVVNLLLPNNELYENVFDDFEISTEFLVWYIKTYICRIERDNRRWVCNWIYASEKVRLQIAKKNKEWTNFWKSWKEHGLVAKAS